MPRVRFLAVLLLLCIAASAGGIAAATAQAGGKTAGAAAGLTVVSDGPSGVRVFQVTNHAGIGAVRYWVNGTWTSDYRPWHVQFIQPGGAVTPFLNLRGFTTDGDQAHWGDGDGVAYAGGPGTSVETPDLRGRRDPLRIAWVDDLPGTAGRLVVAWVDQAEPIRFEFHFGAGTLVTPVAEGTVAAYEMKDMQHGVRAGVPVAAVVAVGDRLEVQAGGNQLWGYVFYTKSTALGAGALTFERSGDGMRRELSLDATPDATGSEICICFEWGRWVFTSGSDVEVGFDYVGDGGRTQVFVVVAALPAGTLPQDVWREFDLTPA